MVVCRELGMTLEQGLSLSVYELKCWAAFFSVEKQRSKEKTNGRRNS